MDPEALRASRILVVDDQEPNVLLMESVLHQAGYTNVVSTTDPRRVVDLYFEFRPDLVLLDLMMPHLDGFQVMEHLQPLIVDGTYMPILVLTADMTLPTRQRALASGAKDFLVKPSDQTEILLRIKNLLETRRLHLQLQRHNQTLEEKVRERTEETHTTIGAKILSGGRYPLLQLAEVIALNHHERWDGAGYPRGLKAEEIAVEARIVAVADAFDAMSNDRPYRHAYSPEDAWKILQYGAGQQWDKEVVEALASVEKRPPGVEDHERNTVGAVHRRQDPPHSGRR